MTDASPRIGIIGGSGITDLFEPGERTSHRVATPWGAPSGPIEVGHIAGTPVVFVARHGPGHAIPPHRVNYRANIDALRSLGAESIVAVNSVGSLREELPPGTFVLPDQFVDLTRQRATTFHEGGEVVHVSMADPFCPRLLASAVSAGRTAQSPFAEGKTYVCIEGPRFSTRAESRWFRSFADVIGMTLVPEATLARERALCYACLAMVTDFDVWAERPVAAA
ncbi:MAG: S-methyl-5'-thioadenosine phosphorylase, partial [Thermoplasmata archaeon]|nr:S-methyl-5'-thioadenosine phosphorylase [Thermoplasmata archaeon]